MYYFLSTRLTARTSFTRFIFLSSSSGQLQQRSMSSSSRRLPVLSLDHTLPKYLKSLEPFLREDERQGGNPFPLEMEKRIQWAKEFEQGIGSILQERLVGKSFQHGFRPPCYAATEKKR